jgi:hypothetical protein
MQFKSAIRVLSASLAALGSFMAMPATAAGDLLVAPTRLVLDGARGTEVILNNIGSETATYRISLELRRMAADGSMEEVSLAESNALEKQALAMISYAPRRVVLAPNQPQSVRVGIRPPADLADGEYRAHMLFRAIPAARPVAAPSAAPQGLSISLQPIYGITIPVIIRKGKLTASAAISGARIAQKGGQNELIVALSRSGGRSVYGGIKVYKPGQAKPVFEVNGVAVYPELGQREARFPIDPAVAEMLKGAARIEYVEDFEAGGRMLAEIQTVIR